MQQCHKQCKCNQQKIQQNFNAEIFLKVFLSITKWINYWIYVNPKNTRDCEWKKLEIIINNSIKIKKVWPIYYIFIPAVKDIENHALHEKGQTVSTLPSRKGKLTIGIENCYSHFQVVNNGHVLYKIVLLFHLR